MSKDDERLRNLLLFKVYATDEEIAEAAPWVVLIILLAALGFMLVDFL